MQNVSIIEAALHLTHAIKQEVDYQLEAQQLGLAPTHVRAMRIIDKHSPCTANDIVNIVKRDKAQITRVVKGLIDQGMVEKEPNPEDKRSQYLVLTAKGKAVQKDLLGSGGELQTKLLQGLDAEELDTFVRVAQQMTKNLDE